MLTSRCQARLREINPDLAAVVRRAAEITSVPFIVTEGVRTLERQRELVKVGASRTLDSRHLTGHAVDLAATVNGEVRWDWPLYHRIADAMKLAAGELNVPLTWGGDWVNWKDGPHFELPRGGEYA
jgi:peptidoglycan L-alanyl-D-glutamate endopeptidase CwlK